MPKQDAEKGLIQLPMGIGLDESTPATLLSSGKMAALSDVRIDRTGSVKIRHGFEPLSRLDYQGNDIVFKEVYSHDGQLLGYDGTYLYAYSETLGFWEAIDFAPEAQIVAEEMGEQGIYAVDSAGTSLVSISAVDVAQIGNIRLQGWMREDVGYLGRTAWCRILDMQCGFRSLPIKLVSLSGASAVATGLRFCTMSSRYIYLFVSFQESSFTGTNSWIEGWILDTTNLTGGFYNHSVVVSDLNSGSASPYDQNAWEAATIGTYVFVGYRNNNTMSVNRGSLQRRNADFTNQQLHTFSPGPTSHVALDGSSNTGKVFMAYDEYGGAEGVGQISCVITDYYAWTHSSPITLDSDVIWSTVSRVERMSMAVHKSGTFARVVYSLAPFIGDVVLPQLDPELRSMDVSHFGIVGRLSRCYNLTLMGQPFFRSADAPVLVNTASYVPCCLADKPWQQFNFVVDENNQVVPLDLPRVQGNSFLMKIRPGTAPDGYYYPGQAVCRLIPVITAALNAYFRVPNTVVLDAVEEQYLTAIPILADGSVDIDIGFDTQRFSFGLVGAMRPVRFGPFTLFSGGIPTQWDGDRLVEIGWNWYPRIGHTTQEQSGGQLTLGGSYSYKAVYVWQDKSGTRHYSAASLPRNVLMTDSNNQLQVEVDCIQLTNRQRTPFWGTYADGPVLIELYRTLDDGIEYYFVARMANDPRAPAVTIQDSVSDTILQSRRLIPTAGGKYATGCPGAFSSMAVHDGRPWGILAADPTQIAFGHYTIPGEAPRFPDGWTLRAAEGPGYTALGTLGDKMLAFQRHSIDAIYGTGPNEQGSGTNYSDPHKVCQVVGCSDHRSLIKYPEGFLFMASSGLWTIDEAYQPKYRGSPVETTLNLWPEVRQAFLDDAEYRIIMVLYSPVTQDGRVLVWHYPWDHWCRWNVRNPVNTATDTYLSGCVATPDGDQRLYFVNKFGHMVRERSLCMDPSNTWVSVDMLSGWVSMSGLQGYGHAWSASILGTYYEDHSLTVTFYYNYDQTQTSTHTWTNTEVAAALQGNRLQLNVQSKTPEVQSVQLRVTMTPGNSALDGLCSRLEAMTIEAANEAGLALLPAAAKR